MGELKEYKLSDFAEIIKDTYNPDGSDEYAYVGLEHIEQETLRLNSVGVSSDVTSNKFKFKANDILFGKLRPYFRKVVKPQFEGICSTDIWVFRATRNSDQNFLFYFLANWDFVNTANNADSGTRMPRADWDYLKDTEWSLPSLPEQKSIASIFSILDDKIDLLHRQNKTLEALAETLFRQWFVEEAEENWEKGKLGDVIELVYGKGLKEEIRSGTGFPVVGSSGIVGYHSEFLVEGPGIVIGRKGTLGRVIYIFENFFPIDTTYFIKSKVNSEGLFYEYFLLKTLNFEDMNTDSAVPGLNRELALSTEIIKPKIHKIKDFNNFCIPLFRKLKENNNQIRTLTRLRDTLLPKLMSGEVRVKV